MYLNGFKSHAKLQTIIETNKHSQFIFNITSHSIPAT